MANRRITDLTALTAPATGDVLPIIDISEAAAADKNKKITYGELLASAPAGSAAAPSFSFDGDPNTGIFNPAADTLAFAEGGVEAMRIDSSGRLGIGTSSPQSLLSVVKNAEGTALEALRLVNQSPNQRSTSSVYIGMYGSEETYERARILCGNPTDFDGNDGFLSFWTRGSNTLSERVRITSTGAVGIGTTSPSSLLHLADAGHITVGTTTGTKIGTATTQKLGFYNATPVVQPTAVADATTAIDVITQLNALLAKLRTLGIIAT
jgi:hypothetical protein